MRFFQPCASVRGTVRSATTCARSRAVAAIRGACRRALRRGSRGTETTTLLQGDSRDRGCGRKRDTSGTLNARCRLNTCGGGLEKRARRKWSACAPVCQKTTKSTFSVEYLTAGRVEPRAVRGPRQKGRPPFSGCVGRVEGEPNQTGAGTPDLMSRLEAVTLPVFRKKRPTRVPALEGPAVQGV